MRRIDVIAIGAGVFVAGGLLYLALDWAGLDSLSAGVWSQVVFVIGLLGWTASYLFRAATKNMTYYQQIEDYEEAVLQKRLEEMSPEEIESLQAEIAAEKAAEEAAKRTAEKAT